MAAICMVVGFVVPVILALATPDVLHDLQSLDNLPTRLRSEKRRVFALSAVHDFSSRLEKKHAEALVDFVASGVSGEENANLFCSVAKQRSELFEPVIVATLTGRRRPSDGLTAVGTSILAGALRAIDPRYPSEPAAPGSADGVTAFQTVYKLREVERDEAGSTK